MTSTYDLVNSLTTHHRAVNESLNALLDKNVKLSTSLSYKTLVFKVERESLLIIQLTYQFDGKSSILSDSYFENAGIKTLMEPVLEKLSPGLNEYANAITKEPAHYLVIAESVAKQVYQCASGDDYAPGYFSKIVLAADGILLEQINHMNSRSLAHKTDYCMRDLTFFIPFDSQKPQQAGFDVEYIGAMRIHFSDRSSTNNKNCGNQIRKQIDEERIKFDSAKASGIPFK